MDSTADPKDLLQRFWRELGQVRTGLLGLAHHHHGHAQPMTAHFDGPRGPLYFFARKDGALTRDAHSSHSAIFHYAGPDHDLYACVHGELKAIEDRDIVARFWSEDVARWYPGGQDDPNLALLRFDLEKAHLWLPKDSADASTYGFGEGRSEEVKAEARI